MKYLIAISIMLLPLKVHSGIFNLSKLFHDVAKKTKVSEKVLKSLCWVESEHKPNAYNPKDGNSASYGICQVKLITSKHMGFKYNKKQLMIPTNNILVAATYLKYQIDRYKGDVAKAVVAYNKGHFMDNNNKYLYKVVNVMAKESWRQ